MRVLSTIGSAQTAVAFGINSASQVVGQLLLNQTLDGVLWTPQGALINLNGHMSHQRGLLTTAYAINKFGQIVGYSADPHSPSHENALLLTPTKQPSSQRSKP